MLDFLDLTLNVLKKKGAIHFYCFSGDEDIKDIVQNIKKRCKCKIINIVKCGQAAPNRYRFCVDFSV